MSPEKSRAVLMMVALTFGFILMGCQKPVAAVNDVQGTWIAKRTSQQKWVNGTNSCQIVLNADGTIAATVPDYLLNAPDKSSGRVMSGKGKWNLEPQRALAPREIKLNFSEVDGERINWSSNRLQAERGKQGIELFFYVGEEGGERFVFERAPAPTTEK